MEMCTRFTIASAATAIEREFQAEFQFAYKKVYNAHFGMELPVILSGQESKIVPFRWGLVPFWSREPNLKFHHINSPARNIVKNPVYRVPVRRRRCLVIANCFFIWARWRGSAKIPFVVYDSHQRLMSFAGIWDSWETRERSVVVHSFSVITTHANRRLEKFSGSMPVIIPQGRRRKYLRDSCHLNEIMGMLRPWESDTMNLYPVSAMVNDFHNNTNAVVMPVGERMYRESTYMPRAYRRPGGPELLEDNPDEGPQVSMMI
jgi:putative SOS response-associated peptidase YedK